MYYLKYSWSREILEINNQLIYAESNCKLGTAASYIVYSKRCLYYVWTDLFFPRKKT